MQSQSFSYVIIATYTYTHMGLSTGEWWWYTHVHTLMSNLDLMCARTHTHLVRAIYSPSRSDSITHTLVGVYWRFGWSWPTHIHTYIHAHAWLLAQTYFFFTFTGAFFLARLRRYTQLAYLFHQFATRVLSRDGRIADYTVRHPGVELPFSSSISWMIENFNKWMLFVKYLWRS